MSAPSTPKAKQLASWDTTRQAQYRTQHGNKVWTFHFLLDASPSMQGEPARHLRASFNMYLAWLKRHADPMSIAEVRCFSTPLDSATPMPLGDVEPITEKNYDPLGHGGGTALYRAAGETCVTASDTSPHGQHVLVVFTDGGDNASDAFGWSVTRVQTLLTTLQEQQNWLAVYLGAYPEALEVAQGMGFRAGNCLAFPNDQIPDAFQALLHATEQYLLASSQERKLLAQKGVFI